MPSMPRYLFIDGAYLDKFLGRIGNAIYGQPLSVDIRKLFPNFEKTFYYHALPPKAKSETEEQHAFRREAAIKRFDQLSLLDGFRVFYGKTTSGRVPKQKAVDVQLAVHMLAHAFRGNLGRATLVAGDLDFLPLVEALGEFGSYISILYDRRSISMDLRMAADKSSSIETMQLFGSIDAEFRSQFDVPSITNNIGEGRTGVRDGSFQIGDGKVFHKFVNNGLYTVEMPWFGFGFVSTNASVIDGWIEELSGHRPVWT